MRFGLFASSLVLIASLTKNKIAMGLEVTESDDEDLKWFAQLMGLGEDFNEEKLMELAQLSIEGEFSGDDDAENEFAEIDNFSDSDDEFDQFA